MIVCFTVNNRPHYLREALESWREVRGAGQVAALFSCEPGCPEAERVCAGVDFFERQTMILQPEHRGVLLNPKLVLDHAFLTAGTDFAILTEEDMVVSTDILEYFAWAAGVYEPGERILGVTAAQIDPQPGSFSTVLEVPWFQGWCWGTWADRWSGIGPDWDTTYAHNGWDHRLNDHWTGELGYRMAAPAISRVQHIGREGGTHCSPQMFDSLLAREFHRHVPPQAYSSDPIP